MVQCFWLTKCLSTHNVYNNAQRGRASPFFPLPPTPPPPTHIHIQTHTSNTHKQIHVHKTCCSCEHGHDCVPPLLPCLFRRGGNYVRRCGQHAKWYCGEHNPTVQGPPTIGFRDGAWCVGMWCVAVWCGVWVKGGQAVMASCWWCSMTGGHTYTYNMINHTHTCLDIHTYTHTCHLHTQTHTPVRPDSVFCVMASMSSGSQNVNPLTAQSRRNLTAPM